MSEDNVLRIAPKSKEQTEMEELDAVLECGSLIIKNAMKIQACAIIYFERETMAIKIHASPMSGERLSYASDFFKAQCLKKM